MSSQDLIDRLLAVRPVVEESGDGFSLRQNPPQDPPYYLRISLRPFGRLGNVLWIHSDSMQAQPELTDEQVIALSELFRRYESEVIG